ncbi:hypothetical protein BOTBODRAFT_32768 [Botryobasidium botryosum FD-172 SS1]|uniref:DUF6593 domain-containing protein n=1 Tax=Botryobasidium botryosum (strain FD-172 SS1) TaxID=930990 RepID=A0A067MR19_BOTB1|nr:hypothetical protein BOTBODRAFT_32768 [Botryobasidium botryosum FD-172 SS1]
MAYTALDSQATLVPKEGLTLIFSKDNPNNTILSSPSGKALYVVTSDFDGKNPITTFSRGDGEVLATLEWRDIFSDKITIGDQPQMDVPKWLKSGGIFSHSLVFKGPGGQKYKWVGTSSGMQPQLRIDGESEVIAHFHKSTKDHETRKIKPATLEIEARGMPIIDLIVISFLTQEKARRSGEDSAVSRAGAVAIPRTTVSGLVSSM